MAKYKTIVDNVNLWSNGEVVEVLKIGSTIEIEKIKPVKEVAGHSIEVAICKDGNTLIASFNGKPSIEAIKTKSNKKKGE